MSLFINCWLHSAVSNQNFTLWTFQFISLSISPSLHPSLQSLPPTQSAANNRVSVLPPQWGILLQVHTMTRRETHGGGPLFESGHTLQNKCSPNNVVCIKLLGDGIRKCVSGLISPCNLTHIVHRYPGCSRMLHFHWRQVQLCLWSVFSVLKHIITSSGWV